MENPLIFRSSRWATFIVNGQPKRYTPTVAVDKIALLVAGFLELRQRWWSGHKKSHRKLAALALELRGRFVSAERNGEIGLTKVPLASSVFAD